MISENGTIDPIVETHCPLCGKPFSKRWDDPEQYCDEHRLEGM